MANPNIKDHAHKGGRPKGSVNKVTKDLRNMIHVALDKAGGADYLLEQAKKNPNAFLTLVGKTLPKDVVVSGDDENPVITEIVVRHVKPNN